MPETGKESEKKIKKEKNSLKRILRDAGISPERQKALLPLIDNVAFMKNRLDEARDDLISEPLTEEYTNGKDQGGVKESSKFKAYENLWRAYMQGMAVILDQVPKKQQMTPEQATKPQTVLELIQNRNRQEA